MRSTKSIILIVIAISCGLVASIGISQVMENRTAGTAAVETEPIYVALSNIPIGTQLTPQMLKLEQWPKDKIPPGATRAAEEVEGKSPVFPLYAGEPILREKLAAGEGGVASRIPEGMRVVAVKVNEEIAASGLILPGDRVDVLVFVRAAGSTRERIKTGTRTILHDVTVFAVNEHITRQVEDDEQVIRAKTVSLLVEPGQAEKLILAKQLGQIHLSLRKPGDEGNVATQGATYQDLDESEGGDQWRADFAQKSPMASGIIGLLDKMKAGDSNPTDTSSDAKSVREMLILSPQGVDGKYTWDESATGLPRELVDSYGGLQGGSAFHSSASAAALPTSGQLAQQPLNTEPPTTEPRGDQPDDTVLSEDDSHLEAGALGF
jgi:pilus assembly protein CpaB